MLNRLVSTAFLVWFALSSAVFFVGALVIWAVTAAFDRRLMVLHRYSCLWASVYLWTNPAWSVTIEGREKVRPGVTYVIVSNHQSVVDILAAYRLFVHFKWVSKAEVFRIPFIGWNMWLNRYIKLRRGDLKSVRRMLDEAEQALAHGNSVWIFPEGTRSETGQLRRFRPGAFVLAQKQGVPVLPVVIDGSKDALPKHSLVFRGHHPIRVRVLDAIPPETFAETPPEELAEAVRQRIVARLGEPAPAHEIR